MTYRGMWLSSETYDEDAVIEDPGFLGRQIALSTWYPLSITEIANRVSKMTSISIRFGPGLLDLRAEMAKQDLHMQRALLEDLGNQNIQNPMTMKIPLQHSGTMEKLFNNVADRFNVFWRVEQDGIWFYLLDTQTFTLFLPGEASSSANFKGELLAAGSASGGGGQETVTRTSTTLSIQHGQFENYITGIKTLVSSLGKVESIPSTGTIIVTDMPHALKRIGRFVDEQNRQLTQQVALNVKVLQVTLDDGQTFDVFWKDLLISLKEKSLGSLSSPSFLTGDVNTLNLTRDGSNLFLRMLARRSRVSVVTTTSVVSLSNQPVPIQITDQQSYVSGRKVTVTQDSTSEQIEVSTIEPGFMLTMIPKVLDKGRIMLQMAMEVSVLENLANFQGLSAEGEEITLVQLPEISRRSIGQRVVINSGQTLVMSGFERVNNTLKEQGTGKSNFWLFGGGREKGNSRTILLVLITPILLS